MIEYIIHYLKILESIIMSNEIISISLKRAKQLDIDNYYIGAGCIAQTVWNYLSNNPLEYGIKDIDFVYFDDKNLDFESESRVISTVKDLYNEFKVYAPFGLNDLFGKIVRANKSQITKEIYDKAGR